MNTVIKIFNKYSFIVKNLKKRALPPLRGKAVVLAVLCLPLQAQSLVVTQVSREGATAVLTLNGCLEIREIGVAVKNGRTTLAFPVYTARSGRATPQVEVRSPEYLRALEKAVSSDPPENLTAEKPAFSIGSVRFLEGSGRLANVEVVFEDQVAVVVGVMKSAKGSPWVSYPSRRGTDGRYHKQFQIKDRALKKAVEAGVLEKFIRARKENGGMAH